MLAIAVFGAALLALVCWVALREAPPASDRFIPDTDPGSPPGDAEPRDHPPAHPLTADPTRAAAALRDATVADADTREALAAAAALWNVLGQQRQ